MKGVLLKKSPEGIWAKRFCETDGVFLTIYRSKSADKIVQIICMPQASNIKLIEFLKHDDDAGYAFDIIMPDGKAVNFKAQSLKDASLWVEALMDMIKMPMPTSLPTTPIDDMLKIEANKENSSDNTSKKRVTFDLSTNEQKKVVVQSANPSPSLVRKVTENYQKPSNIKPAASTKLTQSSQKPSTRQQLLSREDLSLKFYFRRDKQMILTHILTLYPASPACFAAPSNAFSGFAVPSRQEPVTLKPSPSLSPVTSPKPTPSKSSSRSWLLYLSVTALILVSVLSGLYLYPKIIGKTSSSRHGYFGRNSINIVVTNTNQSSTSRTDYDMPNTSSSEEVEVNEETTSADETTNKDVEDDEVDLDHPAFDIDYRTTKDKKSREEYEDDSVLNVYQSDRSMRAKSQGGFSLGKTILRAFQLPLKLVFFALRFVFQRVDMLFSKMLS
jgi:hypothetical protein